MVISVHSIMLETDVYLSSNGHGNPMVCKSNTELMMLPLKITTFINLLRLLINSINNGTMSTSPILTLIDLLLLLLNQMETHNSS
jgi:hypothetical protein